MNKKIYVDNASTTMLDSDVFLAMKPYFTTKYGNPSSAHQEGIMANQAINLARIEVANSIKATPKEIFFTSSASESNNWAIKGVAYKLKNEGKGNHIITSCIEHPSVLNTCKQLENEGFEVTYLPVNKQGLVSAYLLKQYIKSTTILISIMTVNNELGNVQPISDFVKIAKANNIIFHTDATQAIGNINIDVFETQVDLLSFSAHKFYGPKGVGGLYINQLLLPFYSLINGGHQESQMRAGTENVANIIGMGKAIRQADLNLYNNSQYINKLKKYFLENLYYYAHKANIKYSINNDFYVTYNSLIPNIINIRFNNVEATTLLVELDKKNICASAGAACSTTTNSSTFLKPSYILKAIGLNDKQAYESIRISIGKHNNLKQMKTLAKELVKSVKSILSDEYSL